MELEAALNLTPKRLFTVAVDVVTRGYRRRRRHVDSKYEFDPTPFASDCPAKRHAVFMAS